MSCVLTFGTICLISSQGLVIEADISQPVQKPLHEGSWCGHEAIGRWCRGPRMDLSVGMVVTISPRFTAEYGLRHSSYIVGGDRGVESVYVRVTWRPMK